MFLLAVFVAAALLAIWFEVRIGRRAPSSFSRIVLHALIALLLLRVARVVTISMIEPDAPERTMAVLLTVLLPALVYVFLASIWVLKLVRSVLPR